MNNEEKILALLEKMNNRLEGVDKRFDGIDNRLDGMDKRFDGIDNRLDGLEEGQKDLVSGQKALETRQVSLEEGQNILVKQVIKLTGDAQEIRQSQVRMENELTDKIRALFDDRSVNQDYFRTIKNTLARIENNLQTQSFMIVDLKEKQEDQETELRLLRAEK